MGMNTFGSGILKYPREQMRYRTVEQETPESFLWPSFDLVNLHRQTMLWERRVKVIMVSEGKVAKIRPVCRTLHFMRLSTTRSKFRRVLILGYLLIVLLIPAFPRHTSTPHDLFQQCGNVFEQSVGVMKLSVLSMLPKSYLQTRVTW